MTIPDCPKADFLEKLLSTRADDLQGQLNRRIETQQRELRDSEAHTRMLLDEKDMHTNNRMQFLDTRIAEFKEYTDRRLEQQNRFRQQVIEERERYASKELVDARFEEMERLASQHDREVDSRLRSAENALTQAATIATQKDKSQQTNTRWAIAVATLVITLVSIIANVAVAVLY